MKPVFFIVIASFIGLSFGLKRERFSSISDQKIGYKIDTLAKDLTVPWAMVFINDSTMLFNERNGNVRLMRNDRLVSKPVYVLKEIDTNTKMGLLGLCMHPNFAENGFVYIAYNYRKENQSYLKVERFVFSNDSLWQPKTIVDGIYANRNHTGCRLKFFKNKLYITTGDADRPMLSQDLKSLNGKILRVNDDGSIPEDNPFVKIDTAAKQIWSYGHRNSQGIDFQPGTGDLYSSEHGPTGGDEINLIEKGKNYGWPVIHHTQKREGMVSPLIEFSPSIGPSDLMFYKGDAFPQLKGEMLMANLRNESIMRFKIENEKLIRLEDLVTKNYNRIRALAVDRKGFIYFSTSQKDPPEGWQVDGTDMILRIRPGSGAISNLPKAINKTTKKPPQKAIVSNSTRNTYLNLCASCHGKNLGGTVSAANLRDGKWQYGGSKTSVIRNIKKGIIDKGMPAWEGALTNAQIEHLANYIISLNAVKRK